MEKPLIHVSNAAGIDAYTGKKLGYTSYVPSFALISGFVGYLREAGKAYMQAAQLDGANDDWDIEINDDNTVSYVRYEHNYGDIERVDLTLTFDELAGPIAAGTRRFLQDKAEAERKQREAEAEAERQRRILSAPIVWHPQETEMDTLRRLAKKHEFELVYRGMS